MEERRPESEIQGSRQAADTTGYRTPSGREPAGTAAVADDPWHLDGNAAGGVLGAIFPFEMTMAMATCAGCGTRHPLGAEMAYMHGMGTILRCSMCDTVLIRVAHIQGHYFLDLRGMQVLQIAEKEGQ
jgi:hypothetical protein